MCLLWKQTEEDVKAPLYLFVYKQHQASKNAVRFAQLPVGN